MSEQFEYENVDLDAVIEYAEENGIDLDALTEQELKVIMAKAPKLTKDLKLAKAPLKKISSSMRDAKEFLSAYRKRKNNPEEYKRMMDSFDNLFDGQELTEEFKEKVSTIFEAAVALKSKEITSKLEEKFDSQLADSAQQLSEDLVEKVDGYLDLMVEQWFEQNQIAIESGIKLEIFENFVSGMKTLFKECYIEIPEEKADAFAQLEEKVESLQQELTESVEHRIALKNELLQLKKAEAVNEATKGLTDLDAEKLKSLAEDVVYESQESFVRKLEVIKESFFANTAPTGAVKAVVTDSPVLEEEVKPSSEKPELSESVQHFVKALDLLSIK